MSQSSISTHLFLMLSLFQKYLNYQVRTNKMVNSIVYHPCPPRLASKIHPFIFFKLLRVLSFSRMLVKFSLTCIFTMCGKIFKVVVFAFLANALNLGIFTHAPVPHWKLQAEFFENLFPQQQKGVEKTVICFIKIQSGNMKMTLFIFCMICNFS